jgi:hypothetical protein
MLRMDNTNVSFNGVSAVDDIVLASMNANYSGDKTNVYFSFNVNNIEGYIAHKADVDADFEGFKTQVLATLDTLM